MITPNSVKEKLSVDVAISSEMATALDLWSRMYTNQAPWIGTETKSLGLGASIPGEIARAVTIEMSVEISGSARADFLSAQFDLIKPRLRAVTEYGCAKGGLMFKPYISGTGIAVDYVQADQFMPVNFDANGNITACIFVDTKQIGTDYYTRLEYHLMGDHQDANGNMVKGCLFRNLAYKSTSRDTLGNAVPLASVPQWAELEDNVIVTTDRPLYGYFKFPQANNVDPSSPLGVSCFSRAQTPDGSIRLIQNADEVYSNLIWEFKSGERAIFVDSLAFKKGTDDKPMIPAGERRMYRTLEQSGELGTEEMFHEWSPEFREAAIKSGLNDIKREIEFVCGLAYGTISDPQVQAKTATEIKTSQQRSYATVTDTQKALQTALEQLLYAMDVYATLGNLADAGTYETVFDFDDSVIVDKDLQFQQDLRLVTAGLMSKEKFLMRNFRMSAEAAKAELAAIQAEQPAQDFFGQGQGAAN